jgi:hypothetical protein
MQDCPYTSTDLTLGATLRQRVTDGLHAPAATAHQVHYASEAKSTSLGLNNNIISSPHRYTFDTCGEMSSIGILLYPDIAQIALNDLTPAEQEFSTRDCESDDDTVDQDHLDV